MKPDETVHGLGKKGVYVEVTVAPELGYLNSVAERTAKRCESLDDMSRQQASPDAKLSAHVI
jgi:hypothetical protein